MVVATAVGSHAMSMMMDVMPSDEQVIGALVTQVIADVPPFPSNPRGVHFLRQPHFPNALEKFHGLARGETPNHLGGQLVCCMMKKHHMHLVRAVLLSLANGTRQDRFFANDLADSRRVLGPAYVELMVRAHLEGLLGNGRGFRLSEDSRHQNIFLIDGLSGICGKLLSPAELLVVSGVDMGPDKIKYCRVVTEPIQGASGLKCGRGDRMYYVIPPPPKLAKKN